TQDAVGEGGAKTGAAAEVDSDDNKAGGCQQVELVIEGKRDGIVWTTVKVQHRRQRFTGGGVRRWEPDPGLYGPSLRRGPRTAHWRAGVHLAEERAIDVRQLMHVLAVGAAHKDLGWSAGGGGGKRPDAAVSRLANPAIDRLVYVECAAHAAQHPR